MADRELIEPNKGDKRYVRRDDHGLQNLTAEGAKNKHSLTKRLSDLLAAYWVPSPSPIYCYSRKVGRSPFWMVDYARFSDQRESE